MGLYTFLDGNPLYRLYTIRIQPARIVPARLSGYTAYTAHTAYTAIQPYTPYIIQRHTASLSCPAALRGVLNGEGASATTEPKFNQSSATPEDDRGEKA